MHAHFIQFINEFQFIGVNFSVLVFPQPHFTGPKNGEGDHHSEPKHVANVKAKNGNSSLNASISWRRYYRKRRAAFISGPWEEFGKVARRNATLARGGRDVAEKRIREEGPRKTRMRRKGRENREREKERKHEREGRVTRGRGEGSRTLMGANLR